MGGSSFLLSMGKKNLTKNKEKLFGFTIRFYHHVLEKIP
jgi:hypothetical protein